MRYFTIVIFVFFVFIGDVLNAEKFKMDDPMWEDPDRIPTRKPASITRSELFDFVANSFGDPGKTPRGPAKNINTVGEVPDSTWFTNRMSRRRMSIEELVTGPYRTGGPDLSRPLTITQGKSQGVEPGFTVMDSRGDIYFLKFDTAQYPELSSAAEVISTHFFHAFGYNVPENYIVTLTPDSFVLSADAEITDEYGKRRRMVESDLDSIFERVHVHPDGSVRTVASLKVPGEVINAFKYYGTRPDDPNDIIPHQDRRELRGMRVFSSWLNDFDRRFINSLDTYVADGDAGYVQHFVIDFGSTLGSRGGRPMSKRYGHEYIIEFPPAVKSAVTFGIWDRPWRRIDYPDYPSIGRIEAKHFNAGKWKTSYPNPAFERMDNNDAYWATKIVMRFTDEMIRAIVGNGQLSDREAEKYLADTLIARRDKIVRHWLTQLNPLDYFQVSGNALNFTDLARAAGLSEQGNYEYQWHRFDNTTDEATAIQQPAFVNETSIPMPTENAEYFMVRIRTNDPTQPNWKKPVSVYVRASDGKIVGVEREN